MLQGTGDTGQRARTFRQQMSLPEVQLWQALRDHPGGLKFRRQHPSGPYVADFYCHAARLVVEVDGCAHDFGDRPARDAERDAWFAQRGIQTLRITAIDVIRDIDAVVRHIVIVAASRIAAGEDQE